MCFWIGCQRLGNDDSDLDILPTTTLFDLGGLKIELEQLLGLKVDVLIPNSLPPKIYQSIQVDLRPI